MKKNSIFFTLTVLIIVILILPVLVVGEERFSVRNGVEFGMTKEQVKLIEENNGVNSFQENDEKTVLYFDATVAGVDNCRVVYYFPDNKLMKISYSWIIAKQAKEPFISEVEQFYKESNHIFDSLDETLSKKYKLIGQKTGTKEYNFIDFGTLDFPFTEEPSEYLSAEYTLYGFKQYITSSDNNYVEIVIADEYDKYFLFGDPFTYQAECGIRFNFIPAEKYNAIINDAINKEAQRQNDL